MKLLIIFLYIKAREALISGFHVIVNSLKINLLVRAARHTFVYTGKKSLITPWRDVYTVHFNFFCTSGIGIYATSVKYIFDKAKCKTIKCCVTNNEIENERFWLEKINLFPIETFFNKSSDIHILEDETLWMEEKVENGIP